jgi:homoserine dehydrogenase
MFYGRGAGGAPTASAILGDVVAVSRHLVASSKGPAESDYADLGIAPQGAAITKYAIRMSVNDKPGVLANVAHTFASEGVSIQTVRQAGRGDNAELTVVTHRGTEAALQATVKKLAALDAVREVESVIRVEGSAS